MGYKIISNKETISKNVSLFFLIVASTLISLAGFFENDFLYTIFRLGFTCVGLLIDPLLPLCIGVATAPMALETSAAVSIGLRCISTIPAFFVYTRGKYGGILVKELMFVVVAGVLMLLSFAFGVQAQLTTAVLQVMTLMTYVTVSRAYIKDKNTLISTAIILMGAYVSCTVLIQLVTDSAIILANKRLTFEGSVRALSNALAFPIFVIFGKLILPKKEKLGIGKLCLLILTLLLMVGLLVATYSRGVLIAVIVAVAYLVLAQFRHLSLRQMFVYVVVFSVVAAFLLNVRLDTDLILTGISDGNGRFEIWSFFFEKMGQNGLLGYLFGLGPGDILRISQGTVQDGMYSHSVLLDYIFSYGILGGCLLVYMIGRAFIAAVKSKDSMSIGLLILTVTAYATHGNASSEDFHILLGLVYSMANLQFIRKARSQDNAART